MTGLFLFAYLFTVVTLSVGINYQIFPNIDKLIVVISLIIPLIIAILVMSFVSNAYAVLI